MIQAKCLGKKDRFRKTVCPWKQNFFNLHVTLGHCTLTNRNSINNSAYDRRDTIDWNKSMLFHLQNWLVQNWLIQERTEFKLSRIPNFSQECSFLYLFKIQWNESLHVLNWYYKSKPIIPRTRHRNRSCCIFSQCVWPEPSAVENNLGNSNMSDDFFNSVLLETH